MKRSQQIKRALGSQATYTLVIEDSIDESKIFLKLWLETDVFEKRFSRFLSDSELTSFNNRAGQKTLISSYFRKLLVSSKKLSQDTNGIFNPFVLPNLQRAGYAGSWPHPAITKKDTVFTDRQIADIEDMEIGDNWARIPHNSAIDFGGIGKGYLLDQLAKILKRNLVNNFWLSLGGDIICSGFDLNDNPWSIQIQNAEIENKYVGNIINSDGKLLAIATSGVTKRRGSTKKGNWHHIIDPISGKSANTSVLTATVRSTSATSADVLAKCLVITTPDKIPLFNSTPSNGALLQIVQPRNKELIIKSIGTL